MITKFECKGKLTLPRSSSILMAKVNSHGWTEVWANVSDEAKKMEVTFYPLEEGEVAKPGSAYVNHFLKPDGFGNLAHAFMYFFITFDHAET